MSNLGYIQMSLKDPLLSVSLFCHLASIILCALILSETLALYKSFTYLLTYKIATLRYMRRTRAMWLTTGWRTSTTTTNNARSCWWSAQLGAQTGPCTSLPRIVAPPLLLQIKDVVIVDVAFSHSDQFTRPVQYTHCTGRTTDCSACWQHGGLVARWPGGRREHTPSANSYYRYGDLPVQSV